MLFKPGFVSFLRRFLLGQFLGVELPTYSGSWIQTNVLKMLFLKVDKRSKAPTFDGTTLRLILPSTSN